MVVVVGYIMPWWWCWLKRDFQLVKHSEDYLLYQQEEEEGEEEGEKENYKRIFYFILKTCKSNIDVVVVVFFWRRAGQQDVKTP